MIQIGSYLKVCDNSGIIKIKCFCILGKGKKANGNIGDIIVGSIKEINPITLKTTANYKKGDIIKAVIVSINGIIKRSNYTLKYTNSNVVIINNQGLPLGTRINGIVFLELRKKKMYRILSLAFFVL